jgi:23S rRNA maturation-related 3'-5' exoribonuclease YhaM
MNKNIEADIWKLICFIITSAANLEIEGKLYGPLRLLETATKLIEILRMHGVQSERFYTIQHKIDENKNTMMTDVAQFQLFLQDLALEIVDYMSNE